MRASVKEMTASVNDSCYRGEPVSITIDYLADHPEFLPTLAQWQHDEWGHLRQGNSVEGRLARLKSYSQRSGIPLTVVAHENGELLGSASLLRNDMETRPELTPWLAGVFVAPQHRRQGVGAELVRRLMAEAAAQKIPILYLYTVHSETFYANLGWSLQEHTAYGERNVAIMTFRP